ncbi:DNA glycosylase, partial [Blyttiomyces helicus]
KREAPANWRETWDGIEAFRKANVADVDTMGCGILASQLEPKVYRYQTLVALQLSSQTKDSVLAPCIAQLQAHKPGGLTVDSVLAMDTEVLHNYIRTIGFHNKKTVTLKETAKILKERYDGDIPPTLEELMELPGVGPKMAYLCMQHAWNKSLGIGVDVHVHRISNRMGWVKTGKAQENITRMELEDWLPAERWGPVNTLLVGFGQTLCRPIGPKCHECPVKDLCPKIGV